MVMPRKAEIIQKTPQDYTSDPELQKLIAQGHLPVFLIPPYIDKYLEEAREYVKHLASASIIIQRSATFSMRYLADKGLERSRDIEDESRKQEAEDHYNRLNELAENLHVRALQRIDDDRKEILNKLEDINDTDKEHCLSYLLFQMEDISRRVGDISYEQFKAIKQKREAAERKMREKEEGEDHQYS